MNYKEGFCLMKYRSKTTGLEEIIWNSRDGVTPFGITMKDGTEGVHVEWGNDRCLPNYLPKIGDRIFVNLSLDEAKKYRREYVDRKWDNADFPLSAAYKTREDAVDELAREDVKSFGLGTTPHLATVDEWMVNDIKSRLVTWLPRRFA